MAPYAEMDTAASGLITYLRLGLSSLYAEKHYPDSLAVSSKPVYIPLCTSSNEAICPAEFQDAEGVMMVVMLNMRELDHSSALPLRG